MKGNLFYVAVDTKKDALQKVKRHLKKYKISGEVINSGIEDLEFKDRFDVVFLFKVLDHFKMGKKFVSELLKRLKTKKPPG